MKLKNIIFLIIFINLIYTESIIILNQEEYPFLRKKTIEKVEIINIDDNFIHYNKKTFFGTQTKRIKKNMC